MDSRDAARNKIKPGHMLPDGHTYRLTDRMAGVITRALGLAKPPAHFDLEATFGVCPLCEGKGKHVNPSIDSCGLSREDFDNDPQFEEDYFSGRYDVQCYECKGERVIATPDLDRLNPDQKRWWAAVEEDIEDDARYDAMCEAERRMGA